MVTPVLGGLLADHVMEPAMQVGGGLSRAFGWLTGTEAGAGMSVQMLIFGLLSVLSLMFGYILPQVRNMESILPDHDQLEKIPDKGFAA
jgi:hypothetical protein